MDIFKSKIYKDYTIYSYQFRFRFCFKWVQVVLIYFVFCQHMRPKETFGSKNILDLETDSPIDLHWNALNSQLFTQSNLRTCPDIEFTAWEGETFNPPSAGVGFRSHRPGAQPQSVKWADVLHSGNSVFTWLTPDSPPTGAAETATPQAPQEQVNISRAGRWAHPGMWCLPFALDPGRNSQQSNWNFRGQKQDSEKIMTVCIC